MKLSFKGVQIVRAQHPFEGSEQGLLSDYLLTTYGRTTALDVKVDGKCDVGQRLPVKLPTQPGPKVGIQFPMVAPTDSNNVSCSVELDEKNFAIYELEHHFTYYGAVFYKDMFKADHMTQFCWVIEYNHRNDKPAIEQCPLTHLEIT